MARKWLTNIRNYSESEKNSILDRRAKSLFKKAEELSILCEVEVAIISFRSGQIQPIAWKSTSKVRI